MVQSLSSLTSLGFGTISLVLYHHFQALVLPYLYCGYIFWLLILISSNQRADSLDIAFVVAVRKMFFGGVCFHH